MDNEMNLAMRQNLKVVGRTGYGKTAFIENPGKSKMLSEIIDVMWISKIPLSKEMEKISRTAF